MNRDHEHLEFLLSQIADDTLSAQERAEIASSLASDPILVELARRYERLGNLLNRLRLRQIGIRGRDLSDAIRDAIASDVQFQMSQDIDDQLTPAASDRLGKTLAGSLTRQREDQELRQVQSLLQRLTSERPVPDIADLSARIAASVRRESIGHRRSIATQFRVQRHWRQIAGAAAMAAAFLIAVVLWRPWSGSGTIPENNPRAGIIESRVHVIIAAAPAATGNVEIRFDHADPEPALRVADTAPDGVIISSVRPPMREIANPRRVAALLP